MNQNTDFTLLSTRAVVEQVAASRGKPQFILALDNAYFASNENFHEGITIYPMARFLFEAQSQLHICERDWLEKDIRYRQLIPYTVITSIGAQGEQLFWPYQRMQGVGEQRLAGLVSVGFGGHIDLDSVVFTKASVLDLDATIRHSCRREILEEVRIASAGAQSQLMSPNPDMTIWWEPDYGHQFILRNDGVHAVHVGVVMEMGVPNDLVLACAEDELKMLTPMTAEQILHGNFELEAWTRMYLEESLQPKI